MRFTPKSEKEVSQFDVFDPGIYDFEVIKAVEEVSKNGNDMIHLVLKVFGRGIDESTLVHDYIMEAVAFKLRHFAYAVGLDDEYDSGILEADDCLNRSGKVVLRIKQDKGYAPKNEVKDYVVPENYEQERAASSKRAMEKVHSDARATATAASRTTHDPTSDDDIPF